ncbi:MAG: hypothetical protein DI535_26280 [Citrobacter freundii]|nr:MAG: hypothetical protein DI535_26280 [Citrobacter freundii]
MIISFVRLINLRNLRDPSAEAKEVAIREYWKDKLAGKTPDSLVRADPRQPFACIFVIYPAHSPGFRVMFQNDSIR